MIDVLAALSKSRFRSRFALGSKEWQYLSARSSEVIAEHSSATDVGAPSATIA
jgi:hypothetical protein